MENSMIINSQGCVQYAPDYEESEKRECIYCGNEHDEFDMYIALSSHGFICKKCKEE